MEHVNVVFLNIGSLVHKLSCLEYYLASLNRRIDVLVLNETRLFPGEEKLFNLTGFQAHHQPRTTRKTRGGGVVIFTADHLACNQVFGEVCEEFHFLGVKIQNPNVTIIATYRP